MGEGTGKRNRGVARGFRELTYQQSDDGASSINFLAIECVNIYAMCFEMLVVIHLLVKAVDVIVIDLT